MLRILTFISVITTLCYAQLDPQEILWIEGESSIEKDVVPHPWYNHVKNNTLSAQAWLSHFSKSRPGTATYHFSIIQKDHYQLWIRGNPIAGARLSFRIDNQPWQPIDMNSDIRGQINIASDNKPDMRFIAWIKAPQVSLTTGKHSISFLMNSSNHNHGAIDCFVLSRIPFSPNGAYQPIPHRASAEEWFPVVLGDDTFSEKSIIDMSSFTEAPSGKYGFLQRRGNKLQFAKSSRPIQFWGCGANVGNFTREQQLTRIRYLRKHGVNMIRIHAVFDEIGPLVDEKWDKKRLDAFDWYCAQLKENGIYITWSVFYHFTIDEKDRYPLFSELPLQQNGRRDTYAIASFHPQIQQLKWRYLKKLLLHKNPYTKTRYINDPALAVVEFQNEDCIFFHNPLNHYRDPQKYPQHSQLIQQMWAKWIKNKYKTPQDLLKSWQKLRPGDSWSQNNFELMAAYHFGSQGPLYEFAGHTKRTADFIAFLTQTQRRIYKKMRKNLDKLGFKGVTVTTAWRAGGPAADPANLYCDTVGDMIDRHNYYGGGAGHHTIEEGEVFQNSHLKYPGSGLLSSGMYQVANKPFAMTEWSATPPYAYKAEAAPIIAFYGMGLQGWDASYHFLNSLPRMGSGWPKNSKYVTDTPHYIGQFPALSFAIYHHHVHEAPNIRVRTVHRKDLFSGIDPLQQDLTGGSHDYKKHVDNGKTPLPLLAIGKVAISFSNRPSKLLDINKYWNKNTKIVTSLTKQLQWDYQQQYFVVKTKKTQAFIGKSTQIDLPDVKISQIDTPFVSIIFTPLDNKELRTSKHILITAMARDKNSHAQFSGTKLTSVGGPPLLMEPVQATIEFKNNKNIRVSPVDFYGVPKNNTLDVNNGSFRINGIHQTYYYEVRR